ncbi:hypothetical protein HYR99_31350, partial [Candidatus Poribacteria bacterium]|nr:hypothetical protein [Candidatus Poribacteria bacterium]
MVHFPPGCEPALERSEGVTLSGVDRLNPSNPPKHRKRAVETEFLAKTRFLVPPIIHRIVNHLEKRTESGMKIVDWTLYTPDENFHVFLEVHTDAGLSGWGSAYSAKQQVVG